MYVLHKCAYIHANKHYLFIEIRHFPRPWDFAATDLRLFEMLPSMGDHSILLPPRDAKAKTIIAISSQERWRWMVLASHHVAPCETHLHAHGEV